MTKDQKTIHKYLNSKALEVKKLILTISHNAHIGHIGSALSVADILTVLYFSILNINPKKPKFVKRDRFILSKGHAVSALYSILYLKGFISKKNLNSYCKNGGLLGEHPEHLVPGIEFTTGSLGHGLSAGLGMAMAAKMDNQDYKVYVLLSDAECNEGEVWQAAASASHHKVGNLIAIIDHNKVQALGTTKDVLNMEPLAAKWTSFGWSVIETDGHNLDLLYYSLLLSKSKNNQPTVIIANTIRGKGVPFMEHKLQWHYLSTTTQEYLAALKEITKVKK